MWRRFNGARALFWIAVTVVAILAGWIYSVAFVAACSLYANIASDTAAWRSDVNPQLDVIERKINDVLLRLDVDGLGRTQDELDALAAVLASKWRIDGRIAEGIVVDAYVCATDRKMYEVFCPAAA